MASAVTLDETSAGQNFVSGPISATSAAAIISATLLFGADGAAASGSTVYGLQLTGPTASGLATANGDFPITLVQTNATTITGTYQDGGTQTAFTVVINANGTLTVTQNVALEHTTDGSTPAAHDDALGLAGLLTATVTITDSDGDTASGSAQIGNAVSFKDDGPAVSGTVVASAVTLDETSAGQNFVSGPISATSAAAIISATLLFGADGAAASGSTVYGLQLTGPTASGLATANGDFPITLVQTNATTITGTYQDGGTQTAFTVVINANGTLTVTQNVALEHTTDGSTPAAHDDALGLAGLLTATVTITDSDGDTASGSAQIGNAVSFKDDGPAVSGTVVASAVTLDETSAGQNFVSGPISATSAAAIISATLLFGADGAAASGSTVYGLQLTGPTASGLATANGDFPITLVQTNATTITGTYQDGGTQTAFTVVINANGTLTVTQNVALEHTTDGSTPAAHDDALGLAGLLTATVTITDSDGDTASGSAQIGNAVSFKDDGPAANATTTATVLDDEAQPGGITANEAPGDVDAPEAVKVATGTLNITPGADGLASVAFSASISATGEAGAVSPLQAIYVDPVTKLPTLETISTSWTADGAGGGTLTGTSANYPAGSPAFTLKVEADGDYTFTLNAPLSHPLSDEPGGAVQTAYEDNLNLTFNYTATDRDGDSSSSTLTITVDDDTPDAVNDTAVVEEGTVPSVNIVLVIDTSGSMDDEDVDPNTPGFQTRMELAKAAALNLLNSAGVNINQVMVVDFDNNTVVNSPVWGNWNNPADKASIIAFINSMSASDGTSYEAATGAVRTNWGSGPTSADLTNVYFLSDGNPDPDSAGLDGPEQTVWENFLVNPDGDPLTNDAIDAVYAVGIGGNIATGPLEPVAWTQADPGFDPIIITDATELSETLGNTLPSAIIGNVLTNDGVPSSAFGADGGYIKTIIVDGVTYTYNPANGTISASAIDSGLISNTGTQIKIQTDLGGVFVFNFANNGSNQAGAWGYTAPNGVTSNQHETFTYTLVDGDGDGNTATLDITVQNVNKVPAGGSVAAQVDDEGLDNGNPGGTGDIVVPAQTDNNERTFSGTLTATGGDGALTYTFSNLNTTTQSVGTETVQYGWNGTTNTLTATITTGARAGQALFTVALNPANGAYDLVLLKPVMHPAGGNNETSVVVNLAYKVADADADTSAADTGTGQLAVTFNDDTPEAITAQAMILENGANAIGSGALNFFENIGADGGAVVFTGTNDSNLQTTGATNITSGGVQVKLYGFGTDTLTAKTGADAAGNGGTTIFTVKLSPNATAEAQDVYTVQFLKELDDGSQISVLNSSQIRAGNNDYVALDPFTSGSNTNLDMLVSGTGADGFQGTVNASTNGFGVNNQAMNDSEVLRFDFVRTLALVTNSGRSLYDFDEGNALGGHYQVNNFQFTVVQVNATDNDATAGGDVDVLIRAYNADDVDPSGTNTAAAAAHYIDLTDDPTVAITKIYVNNVAINMNDRNLVVPVANNGFVLRNLEQGDVVRFETAAGYDRAEIVNATGSTVVDGTTYTFESSDTFDVDDVGFRTVGIGNNLPMQFNITATDADGDTAAGTISVTTRPSNITVDGTGSADLLVADTGGDTINAGDGNDWLIGGAGADVLNGGLGSDTVSYQNSLAGVTVSLSGGAGSGGDAQGDTYSSIANLMGSNFVDTLTGDGSANVLYGLGGNDILSGGSGDDLLIGGLGQDTLTGGANADTFKLEHLDMADLITDYSGTGGHGDVVDLTALFDATTGTINDYVNYDDATNTLSVDVDGASGPANFQNVAVFQNNPTITTITLLYDDGTNNHTVQANVIT